MAVAVAVAVATATGRSGQSRSVSENENVDSFIQPNEDLNLIRIAVISISDSNC